MNGLRARPEASLHRADDARGDLVLNCEDVDGLSVEPLRPELIAGGDVSELRGDSKPTAGRPHAALEHVADREGAGDSEKITPIFLGSESRGPGRDPDPIDAHERWSNDIRETQGTAPNFPMIGDPELKVAKAWQAKKLQRIKLFTLLLVVPCYGAQSARSVLLPKRFYSQHKLFPACAQCHAVRVRGFPF